MNKRTILNIVIIILLLLCMIVGSLVFVKYIKMQNDMYNQKILDFSLDVIKGNHSAFDIENSEMPENIKSYLIDFTKNLFYQEDDTLLIAENIDVFRDNIDFIKKVNYDYNQTGIGIDKPSFVLLSDDYGLSYLYGIFNAVDEQEITKEIAEDMALYNFCINYTGQETDRLFEIKDNNLYVFLSSLRIVNGYDYIHYEGLEYYIVADTLDKKILSFCKNDSYWQSLNIVKERDRDKVKQFIVSNNVDSFVINATYKWGKIVEIEIVY